MLRSPNSATKVKRFLKITVKLRHLDEQVTRGARPRPLPQRGFGPPEYIILHRFEMCTSSTLAVHTLPAVCVVLRTVESPDTLGTCLEHALLTKENTQNETHCGQLEYRTEQQITQLSSSWRHSNLSSSAVFIS